MSPPDDSNETITSWRTDDLYSVRRLAVGLVAFTSCTSSPWTPPRGFVRKDSGSSSAATAS